MIKSQCKLASGSAVRIFGLTGGHLIVGSGYRGGIACPILACGTGEIARGRRANTGAVPNGHPHRRGSAEL